MALLAMIVGATKLDKMNMRRLFSRLLDHKPAETIYG
jgi:hypothetical protein